MVEDQSSEGYRFWLCTHCRARFASLLGGKKKAVELLREAFSQGHRFTISIHRNPDLELRRVHPPYQESIRRKD